MLHQVFQPAHLPHKCCKLNNPVHVIMPQTPDNRFRMAAYQKSAADTVMDTFLLTRDN